MNLMVALLLTFFVVFALWYSSHERRGNRKGWFLIASLILFALHLLFYGRADGSPQSIGRTGYFLSNLSVLLFMPCAYLYTRAMLTGRNISKRDWLHVLPSGMFLLNAISVFGYGIFRSNADGLELIPMGRSFLTYGHFVVLGYLFLQMQILLPQIRGLIQPAAGSFYPILRWSLLLALAQCYFLWYRVAGSENPGAAEVLWLQVPVILECFVIVGIFVMHLAGKYLSNSDEIIDNSQLEHMEIVDHIDVATPELQLGETPLRIEFQDFHFQHVEEKVKNAIAGQQQFLRPGYTIRMLSDETGVSPHLLSAFINRRYEMNFNDFINEYRIRYCIEKIKNEEWKYKTLEALSRESGFNNRNSFTLSFKKVVGQTPSNFLKTLKV